MIELMPLLIESCPKEGPTVLFSKITTGAGNAPARNMIARSRASSEVNCPVI